MTSALQVSKRDPRTLRFLHLPAVKVQYLTVNDTWQSAVAATAR